MFELTSVEHEGNGLLSLNVKDVSSHSVRFHCGDSYITSRYTRPQYRYVGASIQNKLFDIPSVSKEILGVPCSNEMETVDFATALSGALRWKELSSFTPLSPFLDSLFHFSLPFFIPCGA